MKGLLGKISGFKTYGAGLFGLVYAGSNLIGSPIPGLPVMAPDVAMQTVVGSLLAMFLRAGVAKAAPTPPAK